MKKSIFARGWAHYDLARRGSIRLLPHESRLADLARDYATICPMFMTELPRFYALMQASFHFQIDTTLGDQRIPKK